MAPEQARGGPLGPAADVFALGRVIAEAADAGCGPALQEVIDRATAEDPADRFHTSSEMAAALLHACPPPSDPDQALAEWLRENAPEALMRRRVRPRVGRKSPPPAGRATAPAEETLFAAVPPPPRRLPRRIAVGAAVLIFALPVALLFAAPRRAKRFFESAIVGVPAPAHGDLHVTCKPLEAEVYVDGRLRGMTPLTIELPTGHHSVRVGSPRLERWRAAEIDVHDGVEHRLDVDLTQ
jgi:hypothetical protein